MSCKSLAGRCVGYELESCGVCGESVSWCSTHRKPTLDDKCKCRETQEAQ